MIESIPNPHQRTNLGPRFDWAPTKNNTLTVRYQYYRDTETNNWGGRLDLADARLLLAKYRSIRCKSAIPRYIGSKIVNETRFQYNRDDCAPDADPIQTQR